jgi:lipoprotein-anchoring transpeptidase ErfK/SrfK
MRKLILLSLFICTSAFAGPLDDPRDVQLIGSTPQVRAETAPDADITGSVTPREREKRARAQRQQQTPRGERSDFADNRPGAVRPGSMGGGFIEFLFSGAQRGELPRSDAQRPWEDMSNERQQPNTRVSALPANPYDQPRRGGINPKFLKQVVEYPTQEKPGTIVIDTPNRFLYLVEADGKATRYGIGVGRPGFEWAGVKSITAKKEWPDWRPPAEMIQRRPDLPEFMPGGPANPLGARAMYLGSTLYRIHGSNEPDTIGTAVSSGCIRMRNEDVIDLYEKVKVGTKVIVI